MGYGILKGYPQKITVHNPKPKSGDMGYVEYTQNNPVHRLPTVFRLHNITRASAFLILKRLYFGDEMDRREDWTDEMEWVDGNKKTLNLTTDQFWQLNWT